jgi:hypothetical protein
MSRWRTETKSVLNVNVPPAEQLQSSIIAVKTALAAVEGSEKYDKLFAAVKETLKGKVEEI